MSNLDMPPSQYTGSLMIQGCTSDAGKSTLAVGLCRLLKQKGVSVAPFKPQNMALNSAVTEDGGEIGRAQALQALAAGVAPTTDMNPVLLKPTSDQGAQVIINGKAIGTMKALDYHQYKKTAWLAVEAAYHRLLKKHQVVVVEGAGSPAEINLRENDIANMGFAEAVDCPVILVADIDRGGVFAHIVGTLELLSPSEKARVKGLIINRFRGDIALLQSGIDWLEDYTGIPVLGVLPYLKNLTLDAEDSLNIPTHQPDKDGETLKVVIPRLPRMSNHTDFDALAAHPQVEVRFVALEDPVPAADLIILPGTKNVIDDFQQLANQGWVAAINKHLRYGGKLMGICGGYQMLGQSIHDPDAIEGDIPQINALNLLPTITRLAPEKQLKQQQGRLSLPDLPSVSVSGYEIHAGVTEYIESDASCRLHRPLSLGSTDQTHFDGYLSKDNQILGTYLHGIFDQPDALNTLLSWAGLAKPKATDYLQQREESINRLAESMKTHLDMEQLLNLLLS